MIRNIALALIAMIAIPTAAQARWRRTDMPLNTAYTNVANTSTGARTFSDGIAVTNGSTTDTQTVSGLSDLQGAVKFATAGRIVFSGGAVTGAVTLPKTMPNTNYALFICKEDGGAAVSVTTGQKTTTTFNATVSANTGTTSLTYIAVAF